MNGNQNYNQSNNIIPNPQNMPSNIPNNNTNFNVNSNVNNVAVSNQGSMGNVNTFINVPNNNQNLMPQMINQQPNNQNVVVNNQTPINNEVNSQANNQFVLGTISNVHYEDTIGDINSQTNASQVNNIDYLHRDEYNNQFINSNSYNETAINDLNVEGTYNDMPSNVAVDYINDPQVQKNLNSEKKKTVPISRELKTAFILVVILFAFTFLIPILSDLLNKLRFR